MSYEKIFKTKISKPKTHNYSAERLCSKKYPNFDTLKIMEHMRLQKYLSQRGYCSRREAERLIKAKKITINGKIATLGDKVAENDQVVILDQDKKQTIKPHKPQSLVIAYHKPVGLECTLKKIPGQKTLADINFGQRVFPIGRLDKDSRGLLLLTNDGELCNYLAHPRYQHEKDYLVTVDKTVTHAQLQRFENGIEIQGKKTATSAVEKLNSSLFRITLREGRNRQIRRMCQAVGLEVVDLFRVRIGKLKIGELKPDKWRILSLPEQKSLSIKH